MKETSEEELLERILQEVKETGKLTGDHMAKLHSAFGSRFEKAWSTLKEKRVKKYIFKPSGRTVWIVVGKERDYLIFPAAEFCSCDDFYFRVMDRKVHMCYHLLAQKMAETLGWHDTVEEGDELYETLMNEWRKVTA